MVLGRWARGGAHLEVIDGTGGLLAAAARVEHGEDDNGNPDDTGDNATNDRTSHARHAALGFRGRCCRN